MILSTNSPFHCVTLFTILLNTVLPYSFPPFNLYAQSCCCQLPHLQKYSFNFVVRLVWKNTNLKRQEQSDQNMCSMSSKLAGIKKCALCTQLLMMSSVAIVTISHNALPYQLSSVNPVNLYSNIPTIYSNILQSPRLTSDWSILSYIYRLRITITNSCSGVTKF